MFKTDHKKAQAAAGKTAGQAATELAVFGAILIFIIGTIVRTAVGSSYTQNQNFKAMRMAMLASWQDSETAQGLGQTASIAHNSASVLFVEDRLSPDNGKYGALDRNPFIAQGSGIFSYELLYPWQPGEDAVTNLVPIMDIYINGQHFPFSTAAYESNIEIKPPAVCQFGVSPQQECLQNQCLRNQKEWIGAVGIVSESMFSDPAVASKVAPITSGGTSTPECQAQSNACTIFTSLGVSNFFSSGMALQGCGPSCGSGMPATTSGIISPSVVLPGSFSPPDPAKGYSKTYTTQYPQWVLFVIAYEAAFPGNTAAQNNKYLSALLKILQAADVNKNHYKLFYSMVANPGPATQTSSQSSSSSSSSSPSEGTWSVAPPQCTSTPTKDQALCYPLTIGNISNIENDGSLMFDLRRIYDPTQDNMVSVVPKQLRQYMAWQWSATPGTTAQMIGLDVDKNLYPSYDIDGRLKQVIIYGISQASNGDPIVTYEDSQAGDIDSEWDLNSCTPKPGLQPQSEIFTFTQNGTYLQINEGKMYNPQTGQVVSSANKRNTIDVIQRQIQLSNDTGRFCTPCKDKSLCTPASDGTSSKCADGTSCVISQSAPSIVCSGANCANPNPVEACVNDNPCNCFMGSTSKGPVNPACGDTYVKTCYDTVSNMISVRSRLQDTRGRFWMTDTSGQLGIK